MYCTEPIDRPTAPPRPSRRRLLHPNLPSLVRHQRRKHERKENSRCVHDSGAIPDAGGGGGGGGGGAGGRGGIAHTYVKMVHASSARESVPTQLPHALALLIQLLSCEKPCLQLSNSRSAIPTRWGHLDDYLLALGKQCERERGTYLLSAIRKRRADLEQTQSCSTVPNSLPCEMMGVRVESRA